MNYNNIILINQDIKAEDMQENYPYIISAKENLLSEPETSDINSESLPNSLTMTQRFEALKYDQKRQKYSLQLSPKSFNNSVSSIRAFRKFRLSNSAINLSNVVNRDQRMRDSYITFDSARNQQVEADNDSVRTSDNKMSAPDVQTIIQCLRTNDVQVQFNAAAYLQHVTYQNEENKEIIRKLGGIPALISMLSSQSSTCQLNAASVLRNISYGHNNQIKIDIQENGGIEIIEYLLEHSHQLERRFTEAIVAILCNISCSVTFQVPLVKSSLDKVVQCVFLPLLGIKINPKSGKIFDFKYSDLSFSYNSLLEFITVFLKNLSSGRQYIRQQLRHCEGLIDAVIAVIQHSHGNGYIDSVIVENCVCIIRNLCYALQEVVDPEYLSKKSLTENEGGGQSRNSHINTPSSFGSRSSNDLLLSPRSTQAKSTNSRPSFNGGVVHLWHDDIIDILLLLMNDCCNYSTIEAAIGAVQNLAACDWNFAEEFRFNFRKKKGLPALVIQLNNGPDTVVNVVLAAFRNLGQDSRNLDLIGKHCLYHLIRLLPSQPNPIIKRVIASASSNHDTNVEEYISLDTIYCVLSLIFFITTSNSVFCQEFVEMNGVKCCMFLLKSDNFYKEHILHCNSKQSDNAEKIPILAANILKMLWTISDLVSYFKKEKMTSEDFCVQTITSELKANLSCSQKNSPKVNSVYYGKPYVKARNNTLIPWTLKLNQRQPTTGTSKEYGQQPNSDNIHANSVMPNFFIESKNNAISQPSSRQQRYSNNEDSKPQNKVDTKRDVSEHISDKQIRRRVDSEF